MEINFGDQTISAAQLIVFFIIFSILWSTVGKGFVSGLTGKEQSNVGQPKFDFFLLAGIFALLSVFVVLKTISKSFQTKDECTAYVQKNSGNQEKLSLGLFACIASFDTDKSKTTKKKFSQCVLNDFNEITDDASGKRVVTKCAESSNEAGLDIYFSKQFDPSERMIKKLADIKEKDRMESIESTFLPGISRANNIPSGDGMVILNTDGDLKTCMKLGLELNCP